MRRVTAKEITEPNVRNKRRVQSLDDARLALVDDAIRRAVVAAVLVDPAGVDALHDIPDEELGRRFKNRLWEVIGVATILNFDLRSLRTAGEKPRTRSGRKSKSRTAEHEDLPESGTANPEHYALVRQGKLLSIEDYRRATGATENKLSKYVASGRIFSVELEGNVYIPAFFLSSMIRHNDSAKVIRSLDDISGWSKWNFFTIPSRTLGGHTPLQLLAIKKVKPVLEAVGEYVRR